MPTNVRLHVVIEGNFCESESILGMALTADDESLHSLGIGMVGILFEDLLGCF